MVATAAVAVTMAGEEAVVREGAARGMAVVAVSVVGWEAAQ